MLTNVIGQVGQHKGALLRLVDRRTIDLDVVSSSIDVILLSDVIDDLRSWNHSAITHVEVEESE